MLIISRLLLPTQRFRPYSPRFSRNAVTSKVQKPSYEPSKPRRVMKRSFNKLKMKFVQHKPQSTFWRMSSPKFNSVVEERHHLLDQREGKEVDRDIRIPTRGDTTTMP